MFFRKTNCFKVRTKCKTCNKKRTIHVKKHMFYTFPGSHMLLKLIYQKLVFLKNYGFSQVSCIFAFFAFRVCFQTARFSKKHWFLSGFLCFFAFVLHFLRSPHKKSMEKL